MKEQDKDNYTLSQFGYTLCKIQLLENYDPSWELPKYQHLGDAGFDLRCAINEPVTIKPGQTELIPCGFKIELQPGFQLEIRTRSGLAYKYGLIVLNSPGTVDSGYRGEVKVILYNLGKSDYVLRKGDRIAQGVITTYYKACFEPTNKLTPTERDSGGFGSTDIT